MTLNLEKKIVLKISRNLAAPILEIISYLEESQFSGKKKNA